MDPTVKPSSNHKSISFLDFTKSVEVSLSRNLVHRSFKGFYSSSIKRRKNVKVDTTIIILDNKAREEGGNFGKELRVSASGLVTNLPLALELRDKELEDEEFQLNEGRGETRIAFSKVDDERNI